MCDLAQGSAEIPPPSGLAHGPHAVSQERTRHAARGGGQPIVAPIARAGAAHGARRWLDHRHGDFRARGHGGQPARRSGAGPVDGADGRGLRVLGALLRRDGGDDSGGRERVHLCVRDDWGVRSLDHRLGSDTRVRAERLDDRRGVEWLFRQLPADLWSVASTVAGGRASRRRVIAWRGRGPRGVQPAGVADRARRIGLAGAGHQENRLAPTRRSSWSRPWCWSCSSWPARGSCGATISRRSFHRTKGLSERLG